MQPSALRSSSKMVLNARNIKEIQFVNGLKPGQLSAALGSEQVGTVIFNADAAPGGAA